MPHASLGDRAAVLRTFEVCTSNLKKELGVEPGPETLATLEALIQPKSLDRAKPGVNSYPIKGQSFTGSDGRLDWTDCGNKPGD
jgi:hypothetical protein